MCKIMIWYYNYLPTIRESRPTFIASSYINNRLHRMNEYDSITRKMIQRMHFIAQKNARINNILSCSFDQNTD